MGLPAVYIHYSNLGIPTSFITNEQIFRAGIAPAVLLVFLGVYIILLVRGYEKESSLVSKFLHPGIVFSPIPAAGIILMLAALFFDLVYMFWSVLYPVFWLIDGGWDRKFEFWNPEFWLIDGVWAQIHFWSANGIASLVLLGYFMFLLIQESKKPLATGRPLDLDFWQRNPERAGRIDCVALRLGGLSVLLAQRPERVKQTKLKLPIRAFLKLPIRGFITFMFSAYLYVGLIFMRWYLNQLHILHIEAGLLATTGNIALFTNIGTFALVALFLVAVSHEFMHSENQRMRLLVTTLNILLIAALCLFGIWWYSTKLYPVIPAALGGGEPEAIVIWIDRNDLPAEVQNTLKCHSVGSDSVMRCHLQLVYRNEKDLILIVPDVPEPGVRAEVLVPRDKIKTVSWGKG